MIINEKEIRKTNSGILHFMMEEQEGLCARIKLTTLICSPQKKGKGKIELEGYKPSFIIGVHVYILEK